MNHLEALESARPQDRPALAQGWLQDDRAAFFEQLRRERPVLQLPGLTLVTRHADVEEVLGRPDDFSVRPYARSMDAIVAGPYMLARDDALSRQEKEVVRAALRPADLGAVRASARAVTEAALDRAAGAGRIDVVPQIGRDVPARVCAEHFGIPGPSRTAVLRWSRATQLDMFHNPRGDALVHDASVRAGADLRAYLRDLLADRRAGPVHDDVVGRLLDAARSGLAGEERLLANLAGLLIGSIETVSQAVVQALDGLLGLPSDTLKRAVVAAAVADPAEFDGYVWEALRLDAVNAGVLRSCERDTVIGRGTTGQTRIAAGERVLVCTASAMLDPAAVPDPTAFRPDRQHPLRLHFGAGSHSCLGDRVAAQVVPEVVRRVLLRGAQRLPAPGGAVQRAGGPFPEHYVVRLPELPASTSTDRTTRDRGADGFLNGLEGMALTSAAPLWRAVQQTPGVRSVVNSCLVDRATDKLPARPGPLSTRSSWTSWPSLVDRTFDARHLPPVEVPGQDRPDLDAVTRLFARPPGAPYASDKSTMLFAFFAQWFVDGFLRSDRTPGRPPGMNTSTHEIDLSQLYGATEDITRQLRSLEAGRLKSQGRQDDELPPLLCDGGLVKPEFDRLPVAGLERRSAAERDRLLAVGSDRANSQIALLLLDVLFLREHNRVAGELKTAYPDWADERLFQTARNVLVVMLLRIVLSDYIHHIAPYHWQFRAGKRPRRPSRWERTNWMAVEFNLLYRWHSLVPPGAVSAPGSAELTGFAPDELAGAGLGALLLRAAHTPAGRIGLFNTDPALLPAERASIQLGRDVQLASYNDYRAHCGFPRAERFDQVSSDPRVLAGLQELYGTVDRVELYVGLFAEDLRRDAVLGRLMGRMVGADAFSQALTNPLLAHRIYGRQSVSDRGLCLIEDTRSLADVIRRNTAVDWGEGLGMTRVGWRHSTLRRR